VSGPISVAPGNKSVYTIHSTARAIRIPAAPEHHMDRIKICKKDGTPTHYFWVDKDGADRTQQTVYKQTNDGVKKMTGVHFNAVTNEIQKH
jgi:hypothetical protein